MSNVEGSGGYHPGHCEDNPPVSPLIRGTGIFLAPLIKGGKGGLDGAGSDLRSGGFTLVELLTALMIFTLVSASIYMVIHASVRAFRHGNRSMEIHQSVRVGTEKFVRDLRRAVSPQSIWNNMPETDEEEMDRMIDDASGLDDYYDQEDEVYIFFRGSTSDVSFVVEDLVPEGERRFDLRHVGYTVDEDEQVLVKELRDSVVRWQLNDSRAQLSENETEYRAGHPDDFTWDGQSDRLVISNNIAGMTLAYFDGETWRDNWDSEEVLEQDQDYGCPEGEDCPEEEKEKLGLPDAVAISLVLTNGGVVQSITEIPARDLDLLLAVNETPFGSREFRSRVAYNRDENLSTRGGKRGRRFRDSGGEGLSRGRRQREDTRRRTGYGSGGRRRTESGVSRGGSSFSRVRSGSRSGRSGSRTGRSRR